MALIKCPECGQEISDMAPACIHCGCPIQQVHVSGQRFTLVKDINSEGQSDDVCQNGKSNLKSVKKKKFNPLLISFGVLILSMCGSAIGGPFGAFMARIALLSLVALFISSILCIKKSRNCNNRKGRAVGFTFAILSGIIIFIIAASLIVAFNPQKQKLAVDCATELRSMLKDPNSMLIRGDIIVTDANDDGVSYVIIQYSAANSYGGMTSNAAFFSNNWGYLGDPDADIDEMSGTQKVEYVDAKLFYELGLVVGSWESGSTVSGSSVANAVGCGYSRY